MHSKHTKKSQIIAAGTINFERFYRPFLHSKLKQATKGAATKSAAIICELRYTYSMIQQL